MITTWYLHSHRTWDRLCHSCMGSSFLPHGAFLEEGAYAVYGELHAGSLEALRVTRPKAVDLGCINCCGKAPLFSFPQSAFPPRFSWRHAAASDKVSRVGAGMAPLYDTQPN